MSTLPESEQKLIAKMPANFHHFGAARVGETKEPQALTVRFEATTRLTKIASTRDFEILSGGSCVEGNVYPAKSSCTLEVRFMPQGAGHRLGKLTLAQDAGGSPLSIGLGGYGYAPVVSFTPALIVTVANTYVGGKGLLSHAQDLAVDGGDGLYVADYGNNLLRYMDSSEVFTTIAGGGMTAVSGFVDGLATNFKFNGPYGIVTDAFGDAFFSDNGDAEVLKLNNNGYLNTYAGGGATSEDSCALSTPCGAYDVELSGPTGLTIDSSGDLFFADGLETVGEVLANPYGVALVEGEYSFGSAVQLDSSDNLYLAFELTAGELGAGSPATCYITGQNLAYTDFEASGEIWTVAGTRKCGFSGDGGEGKNAEIGASIAQMAFDLAGNFYFSDQSNNRVRRIDAATGIIHTIAGDGVAGYHGDNAPATNAAVWAPSGIAVGSAGQVYIISYTGVGTTDVIREVGPHGALAFGNQTDGTASASQILTISNTGNDALTVTKDELIGADPGDFNIDGTSTSCNFAPGNYLYAGQSCQVGIYFKPTATGARTATFELLDNTVNNQNLANLTGTGIAATAKK